jgi:hypothetical protein
MFAYFSGSATGVQKMIYSQHHFYLSYTYNQGECYTVDRDSFANTYSLVSPGVYRKTRAVWAEVAITAGTVATREGASAYRPGDYLVSNNPGGSDVYAVAKTTFEKMYEPLSD